MPSLRSSKATSKVSGSKRGRGSNKTSSVKQVAPTSNGASTSEFTEEQLALYKTMHEQIEKQKKAAAAAEDEGM